MKPPHLVHTPREAEAQIRQSVSYLAETAGRRKALRSLWLMIEARDLCALNEAAQCALVTLIAHSMGSFPSTVRRIVAEELKNGN